jgi:hypothetical protein
VASKLNLIAFFLFCVLEACIVLFATECQRCENEFEGEWTASGCVGGYADR